MLVNLKDRMVLWTLTNGQQKTILSGFYPPVRRLAFMAGGKGLASLSDGGVDGAATLQVRMIPDGGTQCWVGGLSAHSLAASPTMQDGDRIAFGASGGSILLLCASDCSALKTAKAYLQQVQDVRFAPVDPLLATSFMDTVQVVYYLEPFQVIGLSYAPGGWLTPVRFDHHGNAIAAMSANGKLCLWDYPVGRLLFSQDVGVQGCPASPAFSPDDTRLVLGAHNQVQIWRTSDGRPIADWDATGEVQGMAISPDGSLLAVSLVNGQIQLHSLQVHVGPLSALAISPEGRYLASSGQDDTVRLWGIPSVTP